MSKVLIDNYIQTPINCMFRRQFSLKLQLASIHYYYDTVY